MTHLGQGKGSSVLEGCRCEATWTPKGQRFSFAFQCHLSTTFLLAPLRSPANHTGAKQPPRYTPGYRDPDTLEMRR
ncbi:unnamed protein product [Caretta caretta]